MKTLRIALLILLAVLLPLRGALAGAMTCAPVGAAQEMSANGMAAHQHAMTMEPGDTGDASMNAAMNAAMNPSMDASIDVAMDSEAPMQGDAPRDGHDKHDQHDQNDAHKCNLCCDICAMTPMPNASIAPPKPIDVSGASFPDLSAPAPSFVSEGPDRPPRSR